MPRSVRAKTPKKDLAKGGPVDSTKKERENQFAFKVLLEADTRELLDMGIEEMQSKVMEIFKLHYHETDLLQACQLDYYVGVLWWSKEKQLTVLQTSALFSAMTYLLKNLKERHLSIVENLQEFKAMLAGTGVQECDVPGGLDCFDLALAKELVQFIHQTFFQHYKLFEFVFTHTQAEEVIGLDLTVELVKPADIPWPPPLDEGLPQDVYDKYVRTPPPTPAAKEANGGTDEDAVGHAQQENEAALVRRLERDADLRTEAQLLSKMTLDQIRYVVDNVTRSMFGDLQIDLASKLRERENSILNRINKIHKVAE